MRTLLIAVLISAPAAFAQPAPAPCEGLPPGKHTLLERFAAQFSLTCDQQIKVEKMLHAEESVSKPLLAFAAFSAEERSAVMLKIKVAARRQVKTVLNREQQKLMDAEIQSVAESQGSGGKKGGGKKGPAQVDPFENEETLCGAVLKYEALTTGEKTPLVVQIKRAALRDGALPLTAEQRKKIEADLKELK